MTKCDRIFHVVCCLQPESLDRHLFWKSHRENMSSEKMVSLESFWICGFLLLPSLYTSSSLFFFTVPISETANKANEPKFGWSIFLCCQGYILKCSQLDSFPLIYWTWLWAKLLYLVFNLTKGLDYRMMGRGRAWLFFFAIYYKNKKGVDMMKGETLLFSCYYEHLYSCLNYIINWQTWKRGLNSYAILPCRIWQLTSIPSPSNPHVFCKAFLQVLDVMIKIQSCSWMKLLYVWQLGGGGWMQPEKEGGFSRAEN